MPYDLPSTERYSRIVTRPDGNDQLICMPGWHWNALDWMHTQKDWKDHDFIRLAWDSAKTTEADGHMNNPGNFHAEFADAFRMIIFWRMKLYLYEEEGVSNIP